MLVYSFHIYRWPIRLLKTLDRWINFFIWSGDINTCKICTVSWKNVCLPWDSGGLDLKSTRSLNASLLLHLSWNLLTQDSQCSQLFKHRFLSFGRPLNSYFKSSIWLGVKKFLPLVFENSIWTVGNGEKINLWLDNWLGAPIVSILNAPPNMFPLLTARLQSIIDNGKWQNVLAILHYPSVAESMLKISLPISPLMDKLVWLHAADGNLTAKLAFLYLNPPTTKLDWAALIWRSTIPPSHSFVFWWLDESIN